MIKTPGKVSVPESTTDTQLIAAARAGDEGAFKILVERYEGKVAGVAIGMLGHTMEAEDAGQETFIRFYRSLERFRADSSLGTYLTRIAVNICLDQLRKQKRKRLEVRSEDVGKELGQLGGGDFRAAAEAREQVQQALARLRPDYRTVLVLRMLEGYSTKETAEILEIPTGTVLSRLARGQKKMKKALEYLMQI